MKAVRPSAHPQASKRFPGGLFTIALVGLAIAGCATPVALRTAPAPAEACDAALYGGVLVASAQSGLAVQGLAGEGDVVEVVWPFGYSATRDLGGKATLRDASGAEIAQEGDTVTMGGGLDGAGVWIACAGTVANAPGI
jgi:hypothetical protein